MNHFLLGRVMFAMTGADFRHCCPLSMTEQHCCLPIYVFHWVEWGSCCCCMTQSFAYTKIHKYINLTELLGKFRLHCVQFEGISQPVLNPQMAPCLASGLGSVHTHEKESFLSSWAQRTPEGVSWETLQQDFPCMPDGIPSQSDTDFWMLHK